jgi:hypothetical protein
MKAARPASERHDSGELAATAQRDQLEPATSEGFPPRSDPAGPQER